MHEYFRHFLRLFAAMSKTGIILLKFNKLF